jgi:hypothetical protein
MAPRTASKITTTDQVIDVVEVRQGEVEFCLLGNTPLIQERMSQKSRQELLLPKGRKNAAERSTTLKHDPLAEYRASAYTVRDGPTLLGMPATAIKDSLRTAALDLAGVSKAQTGRLLYVVGDKVPIWGKPELLMAVVRSADIGHTPDIRSRPILPQWATRVTVRFTMPQMTAQAISRLLTMAGFTAGIGGWRQELGAGNYGLFSIVAADDPEFLDVVATGGRTVQEAALENPDTYDDETDELLRWYHDEVKLRVMQGAANVRTAAAAD